MSLQDVLRAHSCRSYIPGLDSIELALQFVEDNVSFGLRVNLKWTFRLDIYIVKAKPKSEFPSTAFRLVAVSEALLQKRPFPYRPPLRHIHVAVLCSDV
jgi:hypothetical protein